LNGASLSGDLDLAEFSLNSDTQPAFVKTPLALAGLVATAVSAAAVVSPLPDKVPWAVPDRQPVQVPDEFHFTGWLGSRIDANEHNRLVQLDTSRLLEGYRKRPGRQAWDGEHVGKWLHAATLAWVYTGDPALREKLDYTARELCKCQLEDGYLGTYLDKDRWTEWDVWAHKYNLIGLLTYIRHTGNQEPMSTCRRMGDLLCKTFGDEPGKRNILKAGWHVGMAPTSVLEPMVLLYRMTGEPRYLDFCKYILRAWEQPDGPHIISRLLTLKRVDKVGNGKAYEMLSCLNGALEYYRTVGDTQILEACLNAWKDIVEHRLYITGAASYGEMFHDDFDFPNVANVGETCVTVTWEQFNAQLLRLTGEARFAGQLEHVVLNQLFGAQKCDGSAWGYYVQMEGKKPYSSNLDGHCCLSSGPRGVSLLPTFTLSTDSEGIVVNLYEAGGANLKLADGKSVTVTMGTLYPTDGLIRIKVEPETQRTFSVKLRIPTWCRSETIQVNNRVIEPKTGTDGYAALTRQWRKGDVIELNLKLEPRLVLGDHMNEGKAALMYGPLVLAADEGLLAHGQNLSLVCLGGTNLTSLQVKPEPAPKSFLTWPGAEVYAVRGTARRDSGALKAGAPLEERLAAFADAGSQGNRYRVWLPLHTSSEPANLLIDGQESRSRRGNVTGSIVDDDTATFVVTFDNKPATEDWYAVKLENPVQVGRVVFAHGKTFHDGGWFDTSAGKPHVQAQQVKDGPWQTVGELSDYPATTATDSAGLSEGARFTAKLAEPITVIGVRVLGKPASGDNPQQAFSSAAELQAFER
jgi:DUF1680 family protein